MMTLEEFIKSEYAGGKIDFRFRAHVHEGVVEIFYVHPLGKDGNTTPTMIVTGNSVAEKPQPLPSIPWNAPIGSLTRRKP